MRTRSFNRLCTRLLGNPDNCRIQIFEVITDDKLSWCTLMYYSRKVCSSHTLDLIYHGIMRAKLQYDLISEKSVGSEVFKTLTHYLTGAWNHNWNMENITYFKQVEYTRCTKRIINQKWTTTGEFSTTIAYNILSKSVLNKIEDRRID